VRIATEQNGILWSGTAHNQLAQSLAEGGLIGGILAIGFFAAAFRSSTSAWRQGRWLPMALSAALLARSAFDVTLVTGPELLILVSILSVPWAPPRSSDRRRDGQSHEVGRTPGTPDPRVPGSAGDLSARPHDSE